MENKISKSQSNKNWTLNKNHNTIETCIEGTETELKKQEYISNNKGYNNLSKGERIALEELSNRADIIITKANKGVAVVIIMDVKD